MCAFPQPSYARDLPGSYSHLQGEPARLLQRENLRPSHPLILYSPLHVDEKICVALSGGNVAFMNCILYVFLMMKYTISYSAVYPNMMNPCTLTINYVPGQYGRSILFFCTEPLFFLLFYHLADGLTGVFSDTSAICCWILSCWIM
jgi:hypothetical protein